MDHQNGKLLGVALLMLLGVALLMLLGVALVIAANSANHPFPPP